MRFMILLKSDEATERGAMPSEEELAAMGRYNEELANAGVMLAGEGLHPSSRGARVRFAHGETTVIDGPFPRSEGLLAGFWIIEVASKEEAVEWVRRIPLGPAGEQEVEIRQVFEAEDFGEEFTPELRAAEDDLRERIRREHA